MNRLLLFPFAFFLGWLQAENTAPGLPFLHEIPAKMLADSLPPAINCPAGATYQLGPAQCDTVLNYTVVAYDNQPGFVLTQPGGLPSGAPFPIGATVNSFLVTDAAGNTATCSFTVTVMDYSTALICEDIVVVELGDNCSATPDWDLLVENELASCPQSYVVEIDRTAPAGNGPWLPANIGPADKNKTFAARVRNIHNDNTCWGNIMVKDKQGPDIICPDVFIPCEVAPVSPAFLLDSLGIANAYPQISDNCGVVTDTSFLSFLTFVDEFDPQTQVLKYTRRVWTATDDSGNKSSCEQYIYQIKSNLQEVFFPADITFECSDTLNESPAAAGLPYIELAGHIFPLNACAMVFTHVDSVAVTCGHAARIYRKWYLLDSETSDEREGLQIIDIQDNLPPLVSCPDQLTATLDASDCLVTAPLPDVEISDACSGITSFTASWMQGNMPRTQAGTLTAFPGNEMADNQKMGLMPDVTGFPLGATVITYLATDQCGNTGSCQWTITLLDLDPPTAVCATLAEVFLNADGHVAAPASALDAGSDDDCLPASFKIKLLSAGACAENADFADQILLCCADQADTLTAMLRVYDIQVPQGVVPETFGEGHFSDCTGRIILRDTFPPVCDNLPDITVSCSEYDPTFKNFGNFAYSCTVDSFFTEIDYSIFDTLCKVGTITRTFNIVYATGQTAYCLQNITFDPEEQHYYVRFPDDLFVTTCSYQQDYGKPEVYSAPGSCQTMDITFLDEVDSTVANACFEIQRTWFIRNACHFNPALPLTMVPNPQVMAGPVVSAPGTTGPWAPTGQFANFWSANTNGYFYTQKIQVRDVVAPVLDSCTQTVHVFQDSTNNNIQLWNESYWLDFPHLTHDLCESDINLSITATDACGGGDLTINYELFLDLDGDNLQETVVSSTNLPGYNTIHYDNYASFNYNGGTIRQFDERTVPPNQKWGFALQTVRSDTQATATVRFNSLLSPNLYFRPQLPYGNHRILWKVTDACGNQTTCVRHFTIRDGKAPEISCPDSLTIFFDDEPGVATLYQVQVLWSIADNCTPANQIKTGMRIAGEGTGFPDAPSLQYLEFTCIPDANTDQHVEAWVKDVSGNTRFCVIAIHIDSCNIELPAQPNHIIGKITTENELAVKDVSVLAHLSSEATAITLGDTTNVDGDYDIVLDSTTVGNTFVGGIATLFPYKNTEPLNGVTTFDLLQISRHILGLDTLDSPYKIIAADANKSGLVTSFDVVEFRKLILGINEALPLNTSWRFVPADYVFPDPLNPFEPDFPESDTSTYFLNGGVFDFIGIKVGDVNMSVDPQNVDGDIPERGAQALPVQTAQREVEEGETFAVPFTTEQASAGFQFTLSYKGLEVLKIVPEKGISAEQFALFSQKNAVTVACENTEPVAFTIRFRALQSGALCDLLSIDSRITPAAAWLPGKGKQVTPATVALAFMEPGGFALLQNQPNPFQEKTTIRFQLPAATDATLKIFDSNGRVIFTKTGYYEKGLQSVPVNLRGTQPGVYYYSLETPEYRAMKKLLVIGY
ncbi:MAG TPA: HYR domain-containing protein [Saprospiraceae bacterium]|nr:HYR domain-containing protein [Saprospiraceae bacterium]